MPAKPGRSLWRHLRSRRIALYLLVGLTVYVWLVTLIPLGSAGDPDVVKWADQHPEIERIIGPLGLHRPYTTPWFLVVAAWLIASTGACTIERAVGALRAYRHRFVITEHAERRALTRPNYRFISSQTTDPSEMVEGAARVLRSRGMRAHRSGEAIIAASRSYGAFGSPLFHACLTGLFLFGLLGWMTRAEGGIRLMPDRPVSEVATSYMSGADAGPFFGQGYSRYAITLVEHIPELTTRGADRGSAVRLEIRDGERLVAKGLVYPNRPLRFDDVTIHHNDVWGPAIDATLVESVTASKVDLPLALRFDARARYGIAPVSTRVSIGATRSVDMTISPRPGQRLAVDVQSNEGTATHILKAGDSAVLAEGVRLQVNRLTMWAQVNVVHDWSVPWLYAFFGLGTLGMAVATLLPPRSALVLIAEGDRGPVLHLSVRAARSDPAFGLRVADALELNGFERLTDAG